MFFNGMFPFSDLSNGGDIDSWVRQLDAILPGLPPCAKFIPGHDPLASPADKFCREIAAKLQSGNQCRLYLRDLLRN